MGKQKPSTDTRSTSIQPGPGTISKPDPDPSMRPITPPIAELKDPLQWETEYNAITVLTLTEGVQPGEHLLIASNTRSPFEVIVRDAAPAGTNLINTQRFVAPYFVPQRTVISRVPA